MKVKLLKKLRNKAYSKFTIYLALHCSLTMQDYILNTEGVISQIIRAYILDKIEKNRLWYKLLTTLTHKKWQE
jgi:hypothetical protein